jgi:hypothetical protein
MANMHGKLKARKGNREKDCVSCPPGRRAVNIAADGDREVDIEIGSFIKKKIFGQSFSLTSFFGQSVQILLSFSL